MNSTIYGILGQQPWMNLIIYLLLFMIILLLFPKNIFIYKFLARNGIIFGSSLYKQVGCPTKHQDSCKRRLEGHLFYFLLICGIHNKLIITCFHVFDWKPEKY